MSKVVAVIPAAGKGSRLGFPVPIPKIFAPITPTVSPWTILKGVLAPLVEHIEIVLAPGVAAVYSDALQGIAGGIGISMQSEPRGMGDAVFCADWHDADTIVVVWGDQIGINRETVSKALWWNDPGGLTIPMVLLPYPYVQYTFAHVGESAEYQLDHIRQSREGDAVDNEGLSDVGVFVLSTEGLRTAWIEYRSGKETNGVVTKEANFLPFLVYLVKHGWKLNIPPLVTDPDEARGLNTPEDLEWARERFSK